MKETNIGLLIIYVSAALAFVPVCQVIDRKLSSLKLPKAGLFTTANPNIK